MSLKPIYEAIEDISNVSGRLDKEEKIKNYLNSEHKDLFRKVIYYAVNPMLVYSVRDVIYRENNNDKNIDNIFQFLDTLSSKRGCTFEESLKLDKISSIDKETVEIVKRIVTKDLKCGANIKTFKKHIPELPIFELMLCEDDLEKFLKVAQTWDNICWSIKLDGVRCWALVYENNVRYLSRNGKEYPNFNKFDKELMDARKIILEKNGTNFTSSCVVFDGEVISKDKDFQKGMTQLRRLSSADSSIFEFNIFDIVIENMTFQNRYSILFDLFRLNQFSTLKLVEHEACTFRSAEAILKFAHQKCDEGEEGIVLKTIDGFYEFKRSRQWCKVKKMQSVDLPVIRAEYGTGRNTNVLGKLICDFKGVEVGVGSGYDDKEREEFIKDPPKMIEVKYQEITKDGSLRFPIYMRVRDDK